MTTTWEDQWRADPTPTDKVTAHSYLPVYERMLAARRDEPLTIVEVGVDKGGSLELWRRLFPNAEIIGIDIDLKAVNAGAALDFIVWQINSRDPTWRQFMCPEPSIDIFIDDGDHSIEAQLETFAAWKHAMKPGGLYFVEDIYPFEGHERLVAAAGVRPTELFDLRDEKGRIDDVLLAIHF